MKCACVFNNSAAEWRMAHKRSRDPRSNTGTKGVEVWAGIGGNEKCLALLGRQSWHGLALADFSDTWTGPSKSLKAGGFGS